MRTTAAKTLLESLIDEASNSKMMMDVLSVRDRAVILLDRAAIFNEDELRSSLSDIQLPPNTQFNRSFRPGYRLNYVRSQVVSALRDILFALDLDLIDEFTDAPAADPPRPTVDRLREMVVELTYQVQATGLTARNEARILTALANAMQILNSDKTPTQKRNALDDIIGKAIVQAARPGPASRLWTRVSEVVITASAAFTIATGGIALTAPQPVRVQIEWKSGNGATAFHSASTPFPLPAIEAGPTVSDKAHEVADSDRQPVVDPPDR